MEIDALNLDSQLCFPLYVASKEIVRKYRPFLDELDLTYTQYIVLLVLWEKDKVTLKDIGERVFLDSGTLTPLLKELEKKGYITKRKGSLDSRELLISLTEKGHNLKEKAAKVPSKIAKCVKLSNEDALKMYELLYKLIKGFVND